MRKFLGKGFFLMLFILILTGCNSKGEEVSKDESVKGGELKVAVTSQPSTLDPQMVTSTNTRDISRHIFETLLTINANYEVVPMLAESFEESDDGKTITFNLRKGILFHNGEEMKAKDVVASMNRWKEFSSIGKSHFKDATFIEKDEYTVLLELDEYNSIIPYFLAEPGSFASIMPQEIAENTDASTGLNSDQIIGTGPFKFTEWATDQYIHLQKFDDYKPLSSPTDGLGGKKEALVDDLYFYFVQDTSTLIAGLQTGEYDFIYPVATENAENLEEIDGVKINISVDSLAVLVFNKRKGPFADVKLRQAVNMGLDKEAIMVAVYSDPRFYKLDPGLMHEEQSAWYTTSGEEYYNQKNIELAKQLIEESDYDGEEITILTTRDYPQHYKTAVVVAEQLRLLDLNVNLVTLEYSAVQEIRENEDGFDIATTTYAVRLTPHQYTVLDTRAQIYGWTDNEEFDRIFDEIKKENDKEKQLELVDELQLLFYDDLPIINIGKNQSLQAMRDEVEGYQDLIGPIFWNVTNNK